MVLESGENTNLGGTLNSTATTFKLGDNAANRQFRAVLSFNTSSLPDNAVIIAVTLKIKKAGQAGATPFNTLGKILADIGTDPFSGNAALELTDFQATSSKDAALAIGNTPSSGWYSRSLAAANFGFINLTGITQFRLRFAKDDNHNNVADYLQFYSGNYTITPTYRPTPIIKYSVP